MKRIEAGAFEMMGLSGVSLAQGGNVLGIRLATPHPAMGLFDDKDLLLTLERPDAYAPDLGYVCYRWKVPVTAAAIKCLAGTPFRSSNSPLAFHFAPEEAATVTLEWQVTLAGAVQGRYSSDRPLAAALFVNGCHRPAEVTAAAADAVSITQDGFSAQIRLAGRTAAPHLVNDRWQAEIALLNGVPAAPGKAMAVVPVELGPESPLCFTLVAADVLPLAPEPVAIAASLEAGAHAYAATRMHATGAFAEAAEAVAALSGYSRCYDPRRGRVQTAVNRTWGGPNSPGGIFGWDNFFTSYAAAWENPRLAAESLEHIVAVFGENGIARGPTQRNLIIPVLYGRTLDVIGDVELARRTWPVMMEFMRFWFADRGDGIPWRDGNRDGLIESGASAALDSAPLGKLITDAMDETGYDEIPLYSAGFTDGRRGLLAEGVGFDPASRCLTLSLVCQNSLYIASCRKMKSWAERLGQPEDAAWLEAEGVRVTARLQERLFNPATGTFRDRRWDGSFSPVKAMTQFYPLLAGIADPATAERLKASLLDPQQFWGGNLVPTVSRDDPAYCDSLDKRGNYWRGNCWPPSTYIVYLCIKEAGWDDVAAELARRVVRQFMESWRKHGHAYENYPAEGKVDTHYLYPGGPWGGREVRYTWAAMLPLCGLEEVFAPEATGSGVRFGNPHLKPKATWLHFRFAGEQLSAAAGRERTEVHYGKLWNFLAKPGVAVRHCTWTPADMAFEIRAASTVHLRLSGQFFRGRAFSVTVGDAPATVTRTRDSGLRFEVPPGSSTVAIRAADSSDGGA